MPIAQPWLISWSKVQTWLSTIRCCNRQLLLIYEKASKYCIINVALKRKCSHIQVIYATDYTKTCHFDNFRCSQWRQFRQYDISIQCSSNRTWLMWHRTVNQINSQPLHCYIMCHTWEYERPVVTAVGEGEMNTQIARFVGLTWGPSGADRTQVGPMLAPWTLLSG